MGVQLVRRTSAIFDVFNAVLHDVICLVNDVLPITVNIGVK